MPLRPQLYVPEPLCPPITHGAVDAFCFFFASASAETSGPIGGTGARAHAVARDAEGNLIGESWS